MSTPLSLPTRRAAVAEAPYTVLLLEDTRITVLHHSTYRIVPLFIVSSFEPKSITRPTNHPHSIEDTRHFHSQLAHYICCADYCTSIERGRGDEGKLIAHTIFIHFDFFQFGPSSLEQHHLYFYLYYTLGAKSRYSNSPLRE